MEAVHCNAPDSGPMRGNIADSGDVGHEKVVGEGYTGPGGSVGSDRGISRGINKSTNISFYYSFQGGGGWLRTSFF